MFDGYDSSQGLAVGAPAAPLSAAGWVVAFIVVLPLRGVVASWEMASPVKLKLARKRGFVDGLDTKVQPAPHEAGRIRSHCAFWSTISAGRPLSSAMWSNRVEKVPTPAVTERSSTMRPPISDSGMVALITSQPVQPGR